MKTDSEKTFWITNVSNRNVTLADLNISVQAMSSINLLGRRYHLTEEQITKSVSEGSIFNKKHFIFVRKVPPQMIPKYKIAMDPNIVTPTKFISLYEIKQENYEELDIDSELVEGEKTLVDLKKDQGNG